MLKCPQSRYWIQNCPQSITGVWMCVWHRSAEVLCVGKVLYDWANMSAVKHFESSLRLKLVVVKVRNIFFISVWALITVLFCYPLLHLLYISHVSLHQCKEFVTWWSLHSAGGGDRRRQAEAWGSDHCSEWTLPGGCDSCRSCGHPQEDQGERSPHRPLLRHGSLRPV